MSDFSISKATFEEMKFIISQAKAENWNPGLYDATPFYQTDPDGFFIGTIEGDIIGCISAVAYDATFGFIGFYIVLPPYRNQGYGIQLWKHAMHYLGNRSIGLDGVITQQENYKKSGFQFYYKNIRFEGVKPYPIATHLVDLHQMLFEKILEYDACIWGIKRKKFLQEWIQMPNAASLTKMHQNQVKGYGVIRQCYNGYKIGPLFADNLEIALEIYYGLCRFADNAPVFLDVPEINLEALKLAEKVHLHPVFETARMYNKHPPKQLIEKTFGVTTFELG
ncbi:gCN5-related N-acetyltransferase [Parachlamydia acanthamoebae UV-7]|uniref:GCN5-related N-acetyltransferase n=2 Tax=Parachlamydia acanthamoebae TaxID=83552 RepID=F8KUU1_PARAV|nr:GNAT family N-acetyltransferase [Parachlamydia acanthamoebae]CCB85006.1 gCN5-related N-acetyltransferase [Parachlamydia acanthamoebae UV-7]